MADILRSRSDTLELTDLAYQPKSALPLISKKGKVRQLDETHKLLIPPESLTFTYSGNKVLTITNRIGTKTFTYSGGKVSTISDTETGKVSTFTYSAGKVTSITISDI